MKIIDFERKGNVVRFYLGKDDLEDWHGDDWDDAPYEYNAGRVYDEFISGHIDIAFPYSADVLEPRDGCVNSPFCKDDMKARRVPCIIVVPEDMELDDWNTYDFARWACADGIQKYYFGDRMDPNR